VPIQQQDILVALNYHSTEPIHQKIPFDMGIELPGGSFYTPSTVGWSGFQQYDFAPAPTTMQVESPRAAPTPSYAAPVVHAPDFTPQAVPITPPAVTTLGIPHHSTHHPPIDRGGPFRPSVWEYETNIAPSAPHPSLCQTAIFRKYVFQLIEAIHDTNLLRSSHYNIAHFNNPDFEPEQWQPGNDYHQPGDRGRKRSSHSQ
jgi:ubiquitin thioesterase protein OTUB1